MPIIAALPDHQQHRNERDRAQPPEALHDRPPSSVSRWRAPAPLPSIAPRTRTCREVRSRIMSWVQLGEISPQPESLNNTKGLASVGHPLRDLELIHETLSKTSLSHRQTNFCHGHDSYPMPPCSGKGIRTLSIHCVRIALHSRVSSLLTTFPLKIGRPCATISRVRLVSPSRPRSLPRTGFRSARSRPIKSPVTPLDSALLQVFILFRIKSFRMTIFRKTPGAAAIPLTSDPAHQMPARRSLSGLSFASLRCIQTSAYFFLPVVGGSAMLPQEMLVVQMLRDRPRLRIRPHRRRRHRRNLFDDHRRVSRFRRRGAPAKRRMPRHQHSRHMQRIQLREPPHDRVTRVHFVVVANLFRRQRARHRNRPVKIIRVRRPETRNLARAPAPTPLRIANACAPLRQFLQMPCTKSNASANPTTAANSLPPSCRSDRPPPDLLASSIHTARRSV